MFWTTDPPSMCWCMLQSCHKWPTSISKPCALWHDLWRNRKMFVSSWKRSTPVQKKATQRSPVLHEKQSFQKFLTWSLSEATVANCLAQSLGFLFVHTQQELFLVHCSARSKMLKDAMHPSWTMVVSGGVSKFHEKLRCGLQSEKNNGPVPWWKTLALWVFTQQQRMV